MSVFLVLWDTFPESLEIESLNRSIRMPYKLNLSINNIAVITITITMEKHLAKEIYTMAQQDYVANNTSDDLKQTLHESYEAECKKLRDQLKKAIKAKIAEGNVSDKCEYNLYDNRFPVSTFALQECKIDYRRWCIQGKYRKHNGGCMVTVKDKLKRKFLDDVIYKLDLDWKPGNINNCVTIVVTWDHWLKK